jgi:hypothetical protein
MHIIELQRKLQEARNERHPNSSTSTSSKYRLRTASVEKDVKDASELLMAGVSPHEVSELLGIHPSEVARIEEYNQRKKKFLMTGNLELPGSAAGFTIFQR